MKPIPTIEIVRQTARDSLYGLSFEHKRAQTLTSLEALAPDPRALMWLCFLDLNWGRDGLHTFFFLESGDFAPQVLASLRHVKLDRDAAIFNDAMRLFGPKYPVKEEERKQFFAWGSPGRKINEYTTIPNQLNAFDHALMAKGDEFGSREAFSRQIVSYVEGVPALLAWVGKAHSEMTEEDRLYSFLKQLTVSSWDSVHTEIAAWSKPECQIFLLHLFNEEMLNGGVHQFFFNSSGDLAVEVVATMRDVGLVRHADALQGAVDMFGVPYPSDTNLRRDRYFRREWSDWDEKLNEPTDAMDDGAIFEKMLEIAKREALLPQ